jgi:hypothetical protein
LAVSAQRAWASPGPLDKLSSPVAALPAELQTKFREQLIDLPPSIEILPFRQVSWRMAELQHHHRVAGRQLSAAMVEALAAAQILGGAIAVSANDVGPSLQAAAEAEADADADGIEFHVL